MSAASSTLFVGSQKKIKIHCRLSERCVCCRSQSVILQFSYPPKLSTSALPTDCLCLWDLASLPTMPPPQTATAENKEDDEEQLDLKRFVRETDQLKEDERRQRIEVKCRYGDSKACNMLVALYRSECLELKIDEDSSTDSDAKSDKVQLPARTLTACSRLAAHFLKGVGVKQNTPAAERLFR